MDERKRDGDGQQLEDLENERPGFTPAGRRKEDAEKPPSTTDRHQPSALGGEVATRSKADPDE